MSQSKLDIQEAINKKHAEAGYLCQHQGCYEKSVQVAHLIRKGRHGRQAVKSLWYELTGESIKIWGERMNQIIHHPRNCASSCVQHNSYFLVGMSDINQHKEILRDIWDDLK